MALISWVGSGLCSIPQLVVFGVQQAPTATPFYQCVTHGYYEEDWQETAYILATFTVMGAAPLFVIITCYTAIFLKLQVETHHRSLYSLLFKRNQEKIVSNESTRLRLNTGTKRDEIMRRAVMKSLWISLLVIITFIICWAPYYIAMLYYLIVRDANNQQVLLMSQIIFVFGMSNSVFNPIIYGASHLLCCRKSHLARGSTMRKGTRMTVRLSQRDLPQPPPDSPPIPAALRPLRTSRSL
ncbi:putative Gonadotropin-releasing hormone II receptor [Hypsibius exemplaris]|uniref:Gonadotropin-releasing hormone II receptor n=1 Tax=Hypsibius exemplaris TaxID=2072580 RepID=A0A1W0W9H0_HYPEX|nr:putative Gonadotropin-releasing hormone II receptor [Hypsibius exemplaris]